MWLNVGCGPFPAPSPWWNVDVVSNENTHPDQVVPSEGPLPFPDRSCERIYLGHVLEHVAWDVVPSFLADVRRLLAADGEVCVVGPDVHRAVRRWAAGDDPWEIVLASIEDDCSLQTHIDLSDWPQARHWWNCHEARVARALTVAGFSDVTPLDISEDVLAGWPVVAFTQHQCAVHARA